MSCVTELRMRQCFADSGAPPSQSELLTLLAQRTQVNGLYLGTAVNVNSQAEIDEAERFLGVLAGDVPDDPALPFLGIGRFDSLTH